MTRELNGSAARTRFRHTFRGRQDNLRKTVKTYLAPLQGRQSSRHKAQVKFTIRTHVLRGNHPVSIVSVVQAEA